jgi:hypothetical protein
MKKLILLGLLSFSLVSFSSCLKKYECDCPAGTKHTVHTTDEESAANMCFENTSGRCSY